MGSDILYGAAGIDTFVIQPAFGMDTIYNFTTAGTAHDYLQFDPTIFAAAANVLAAARQVGTDVVITANAQDQVTLKNATLASLTAADIRIG